MSIEFEIPVSQEILTKISRLDRFRGEWVSGLGLAMDRMERLEEAALVQSVAASCRLSGMPVSEHDVVAVLREETGSMPDAAAIHGYAAGLRHPFPGPDEVVGTETLRELNRVILQRDDPPAETGWREQPLNREAFDSDGHALGWVFPTLPPRMIAEKIEDLMTWLELELRGGETHPVLAIGCFTLGFLAISPFERGNGRTSRTLISRLLIRAGYQHLTLASVEAELERNRAGYLDALFQARTGVWSGTAKLDSWLGFFLGALDDHRERVENKLALERGALDLPPLQQEILDTVREHGTVNASLLLKATGANRNTLKDNLRRLVERGVLERTGQKRGTRYRLAGVSSPPRAPEPVD